MPEVDFKLYLITDRLAVPAGRTLIEQVEAALRGGVKAVQLREKDLPPDDFLALARPLRQLTRRNGARLLVNTRLDIAVAVEADGIHLPGSEPDIAGARRVLGPDALIGVSTHSFIDIHRAADAGADFVTFGPVYRTASKLRYGHPLGLEQLRDACTRSSIPVFALGGVTPERLDELRRSGCTRLACIGAIIGADDPEAAARAFYPPDAR